MFKNRSLGRDIIQVWGFNHLVSITSQSIPTLLVGHQKQDIRVCHALDYQAAHSAKSTVQPKVRTLISPNHVIISATDLDFSPRGIDNWDPGNNHSAGSAGAPGR